MKKLVYGGMFLTMLVTGIVACKKENVISNVENAVNKSYTVEKIEGLEKVGSILKFSTIEDYVNFVEDSVDTKWDRLEQYANANGFQNYFTQNAAPDYFTDTLSMDDDLGKLLNVDGVVILGDYAVKVDVAKQRVFVSTETNLASNYEDLIAGNTSNKAVKAFSTEEDVVDIMLEGEVFKCSEGGVGSRSKSVTQSDGQNSAGVNTILRHSKFGIYFTLVIESSSSYPLSQFKYEFSSNSNERRFKRRCQNMQYVGLNWSSLMSVNSAKYKFNESVKNYSKYHVKARCHYYKNDLFMSQSQLVSTSTWLEIRINL